MILKGKVALIYGAGGAIGGAIARAFAAEGARVFLTGRSRAAVESAAKDIGGGAEAAEVDAVDEQAIDKHLQAVIEAQGRWRSGATISPSIGLVVWAILITLH